MIGFTFGRDKQFRPILYLYPNRLKTKDCADFGHFLNTLLMAMTSFMYKPYFIENLVIIMDVEKKGVVGFPFKAVKQIIDATNLNFCCSLHRLFIVNPSFIFSTGWSMVKGWLDPETTKKIVFLKKKEFHVLQKDINADQLLDLYGGTLETPKQAFPIINTLDKDAEPVVTEEQKKHNNYIKPVEKVTVSTKQIFSIEDMDEGLEFHKLETRSVKTFINTSDFSKEMISVQSLYWFKKTEME